MVQAVGTLFVQQTRIEDIVAQGHNELRRGSEQFVVLMLKRYPSRRVIHGGGCSEAEGSEKIDHVWNN